MITTDRTQLHLFGSRPPSPLAGVVARARHDGPDTSHAAAAKLNTTKRFQGLTRDALAFVRRAGARGATLDEWLIDANLPTSHSGCFTALAKLHLIRPTGAKRNTRTGSAARVFVTTPEGDREC